MVICAMFNFTTGFRFHVMKFQFASENYSLHITQQLFHFTKLKLIGLSWNISLHAIQLGLHLIGKNLSAELMTSLPGSLRPDQQLINQALKSSFLSLSITGNTRALGEPWACCLLVCEWKPLLVSISWSQGRRVYRQKRRETSMLTSQGSWFLFKRNLVFSMEWGLVNDAWIVDEGTLEIIHAIAGTWSPVSILHLERLSLLSEESQYCWPRP